MTLVLNPALSFTVWQVLRIKEIPLRLPTYHINIYIHYGIRIKMSKTETSVKVKLAK